MTSPTRSVSNNDTWDIWEICSYDSLVIDLKISNLICWPFRGGVSPPRSGLSHVWTAWHDQPSKIWSSRSLDVPSLFSVLCRCKQFKGIIFQPCWRLIENSIGCFANGVTRELVSDFFGMKSGHVVQEEFQAVRILWWLNKRASEFKTLCCLCQQYLAASVMLLETKQDDECPPVPSLYTATVDVPPPGCSPVVSLQWACIASQPVYHYATLWWSQCILFICPWC